MSTWEGVDSVILDSFLAPQFAIIQEHNFYICIKSFQFDLGGVFLAAENAVERSVGINC